MIIRYVSFWIELMVCEKRYREGKPPLPYQKRGFVCFYTVMLFHISVAIVCWRNESFLDHAWEDPTDEVELTTSLVVCAGSTAATEWLQTNYCTCWTVVHIEVSCCVAQLVGNLLYCKTVLTEY